MPKAKRKQLNIGITPDQYEAVRIAAEEEGADHHGLLPFRRSWKRQRRSRRSPTSPRLPDLAAPHPAIHQQGEDTARYAN